MSTLTANRAYASTLASGNRELVYPALVVFGIALIALSAKVQVPFWPVPMTLQTMAIAGIAAAYGFRLGLVTVFAYLAAGLMGAPVFATFASGPAYFAGPTAGFLAGFVVLTAIVGWTADRVASRNFPVLLIAMIFGTGILFAMGFTWLGYGFAPKGATLGASFAWENGVAPFILGDFVKMVLAAAVVSLMARR